MPILPPRADFGAIFGFWWSQKSTLGATFSRKLVSQSLVFSSGERSGTVLGATCGPKWSQDAPRPEFHRFWIDFQRILVDFVRNLEMIHMCLNRHPTNPETNKHLKQKHTNTQTRNTKSQNHKSKTLHEIQNTKYQIPDTTPIKHPMSSTRLTDRQTNRQNGIRTDKTNRMTIYVQFRP